MKYVLSLILAAPLLALGVSGARSQQKEEIDPRLAALDKGPATIDVSGYPGDVQKKYRLFSQKCVKCHTLARPINSDFVLEEEWERYIKRMMRKPGSGISSAEGKEIYEFLAFDSKQRKKDLYEKRRKEMPQPPKGL